MQSEDQKFYFQPYKGIGAGLQTIREGGATGVGRFAGNVSRIAMGCATILEMLEQDATAASCGDVALLNPCHAGALRLLAIECLKTLDIDASEHAEWFYKHHTPQGRGEVSTDEG